MRFKLNPREWKSEIRIFYSEMKKCNTVPVFDTDMTEHLKIDPVKYKIEISMVKMELSDIGA